MYKINHPKPLQIGLNDAHKLWLDAHTLGDLLRELRRKQKREEKNNGERTSAYLGVSRSGDRKRPWVAKLYRTVTINDGPQQLVWTQSFEHEDEAASAWDGASLWYWGRCHSGARISAPQSHIACCVARCVTSRVGYMNKP